MISREELMMIPRLHRGMIDDVQRLHYLREKATCIPSSGRGNPNKVQTTRTNRAGHYVDEAADLRAELEIRHEELEAMKREAEAWIRTLDDARTRRIMRELYVKCRCLRYIAEAEHITLRRAQQIRAAALSQLEN